MSNTYTLSKTELLHAIKTERLTSGDWVKQDYGSYQKTLEGVRNNPGECRFCAVGAVLAAVLPGETLMSDLNHLALHATKGCTQSEADEDYTDDGDDEGYHLRHALFQLKAGNLMGALTLFFEGAFDEHGDIEEARQETLDFVEVNFPMSITFTT